MLRLYLVSSNILAPEHWRLVDEAIDVTVARPLHSLQQSDYNGTSAVNHRRLARPLARHQGHANAGAHQNEADEIAALDDERRADDAVGDHDGARHAELPGHENQQRPDQNR